MIFRTPSEKRKRIDLINEMIKAIKARADRNFILLGYYEKYLEEAYQGDIVTDDILKKAGVEIETRDHSSNQE